MFRIALKGILGRKARLVLTSLAVILGTSFLAGTSVFSATLNRTFDNLFSDVFKNVDAFVRSSQVIEGNFGQDERSRIPVSLVDTVKAVPGVSDAAPDIQAFARIIGEDGKPLGSNGNGPPTFGGIYVKYEGALWTIAEGSAPVASNEVALDEASAKKGGFSIGDPVKIVAQSGSRTFTLVGIASYGDVRSPGGATFALFDPVTAADFLAKPGFIDNILVTGDGSLSDEELAARINAAIPPEYKTETLTGAEVTKETQDQIGSALSFFGTVLTVFSAIALGVGCFVIYNVFSISAAQRQRENALLRAIGASRSQVTSAMLIESVVVGVIGSVTGLIAGIGLSRGLTAALKAVGIDVPSGGLVIPNSTIRNTILVGTLVTVASALLPARRAGKVPPLAAMRATALEIAEPGRKRLIGGVVSITLGLAVTGAVIAGANSSNLGIGILLVFVGTIVLGPIISRPVALFLGRPAARFRGVTGVMARQNSARNPKRTARTASPVLIGVALVTAVTALAASIKGEIDSIVTKQFNGNYAVITEPGGFGGLSPSLAVDIAKLPEVAQATGIGIVNAKVEGKGQFVTTISPSTIEGLWDLGLVDTQYSQLTADSILVSKKKADTLDLAIGSTRTLQLSDGTEHVLKVVGYFEFNEIGDYAINRELLGNTAITTFDMGVYIATKPSVSDADARVALEKAVKTYGQGELVSKREYIDKRAGSVNQLLGLIYGLLSLSIIIAVVGIIITLLLSVFERQRELGLLRAVGMTQSQVRTTVRWESVITSILGAVLGVILGLGLGWVIVLALRDQGLRTFSLPIVSTLWIMVMSFVVGLLAAVYPAWRATKVDILSALNTN